MQPDSQKAPMAQMAGQAQFASGLKKSVSSASEIPIAERQAVTTKMPMKMPTPASNDRGFRFRGRAIRSGGTIQVATARIRHQYQSHDRRRVRKFRRSGRSLAGAV